MADYLAHLAQTHKTSTITRKLTAIGQAHEAAKANNPELRNPAKDELVRLTMRGMRRDHGTAPVQKAPAVTDDVRSMLAAMPDNLLGLRDRALLLVGFAGAFRRSELVCLSVEDLEWKAEGLVANLRKSKTDQDGWGLRKAIPKGRHSESCPVLALQTWLRKADIEAGAIFRRMNRHGQVLERLTDKGVALAVERWATAADLDPRRYSGHSLRAGLATSAAAAGVQERDIMRQTGHRSLVTLRKYIREGELFRDNAAAYVGL